MRFRVGPHEYHIQISSKPIADDNGEYWGICDERGHYITIACDCPARDRLPTLGHELAHAWIYATGRPSTDEGLCDLFGSMFAVAVRDLIAGGGEVALQRLGPGETALPINRRTD